MACPALARVGDTLGQLQDRYGLQKTSVAVGTPLVVGAKEFVFEFEGFRIRCALLKATDGEHYCVRQAYSKLTKPNATLEIRDFEVTAILSAEAGGKTWTEKTIGTISLDALQRFINDWAKKYQLGGKVWLRTDGAVAVTRGFVFTVELPLASKYEEEYRQHQQAKERANVPKF